MAPRRSRLTGLTKRFGSFTALDDLTITVRDRRGLRLPRTERGGQDDDHQGGARSGQADRGLGPGVRLRRLGRARARRTGGCRSCPASSRRGRPCAAARCSTCSVVCTAATTPADATSCASASSSIRRSKGREYSKGNRQKIALIAAFMVEADLLVLDEPTSGLDPLMEIEFRCVRPGGPRQRADGVPLVAHPVGGRGGVRPCGDPAQGPVGRGRHARRPPQAQHPGGRDRVRAGARARTCRRWRGVQEVRADGSRVTLRLKGSPNELMRALAAHDVRDLDIREPSLEELFLTYYGEDGRQPRAPADVSLARFAWRQLWRGAVVWAAVIGASSCSTGVETFKTRPTRPRRAGRRSRSRSAGCRRSRPSTGGPPASTRPAASSPGGTAIPDLGRRALGACWR